jgi:TolB-like protein
VTSLPTAFDSLSVALGNRYSLEREIGRGGMATVYLARDLNHPRLVALKVLRVELAAALGTERFLREIEIASRLQHPNILGLIDSGSFVTGTVRCPYYIMPYVEGESLRSRLLRESQLPVEEALRLTGEIAAALDYAHRHGVIHRDIKPENVLLEDGHAIVADFGIARALDLAGTGNLTETGLSLGTPAYMSPEQAAAERTIDGRSDIYSLACLTYELLAGHPPFLGASAREIMARHALDTIPSLRIARATVPIPVEAAIKQALAKAPADRFATAADFARALEAPPELVATTPPSTHPRRRPHLLAAVGAALLIAIPSAWLLRPRGAVVIPEAATIAVLPFAPATADTALIRLGQDLAATLSVTLDGVGEIRTVDRFTILAQTANQAGPPSLEQGIALGRRFGAASVLHGSLVHDGGKVRLDAVLSRTDRPVPVARVSVRAPAESLSALTDSVVWGVLHQVWLHGEPPSPSLAGLTTRSVPALRAFLEGEHDILQNLWTEAGEAFGRAIAADSTFSLAQYRYAESRAWVEEPIEPVVLTRLRRDRTKLPERDRLLVDAWLAPSESLSITLRLMNDATHRFPNYWPAWFYYGDRLAHFGPMLGHPVSEARQAFRRALALNSRLLPAWQHLAMVSYGRDTAAVRESMERREQLGWYSRPERATTFLPWSRLHVLLGQGAGALDGSITALLDTVAGHIVTSHGEWNRDYAPESEVAAGFAAAQIELNQRVLRLGVAPDVVAANFRGIALAWAVRGAWDSALVYIAKYVNEDPTERGALDAYALSVLGAWLDAIGPAEAVRWRSPAYAALNRRPAELAAARAKLGWYDGILAFTRGDQKGLADARDSVRRTRAVRVAVFNDRSLAAFQLALAGQRGRAGRELAQFEWTCANDQSCGLDGYDIAIHRLAAARWLAEEGDVNEAARLLTWHEAAQSGPYWAGTEVTAGLAYRELARIEEARGSTRLSRESYEQFLRRYDRPMPSQAHLVEEAKAALARLQEERK